MKNICIVICWFGKLPNYFKIWELSASYNKSIDFYIFTDQKIKTNYKNIRILDFSIDDFNKLASKKLLLNIKIKNAYKLCDFKVAYGKIFEDYLKKYDFFGYCDIDLVFGDIRKFITNEVLNSYDKINNLGHFGLYKNDENNKNLFMKKGSIWNYKTVFTSNFNYAFDEHTGMQLISKSNKTKEIIINSYLDMSPKANKFKIINHKNYVNQIFYWNKGKLYRNYDNLLPVKDEFFYLHFQKKKPTIFIENYNNKIFINENFITDNIDLLSKSKDNKNGDSYLIKKLNEFIKCPLGQKKIWIRQKVYKYYGK